ncbi:hypothetical protein BOX15_Mlig017402g1 [Macrostomum lignano]|uniref:ABC transporter domain-containing protein n=1 Tax=Macrostomum lignano TaxID=282301 RepID=A0A267E4C1_9PLAT|nr:hypothetical protein BOX15_Mlig017402g1 [Macrostomum lignano]
MDSAVLTEAVQILETSGEVETFGLSQASLDDVFMRLGGMDSEDIIKAFRAGTLLLPQRTEILSVPVETPEVKEASDQLMTSSTKMRTFVTGQFAALFKINIKRQVRVKANLASRFLVPAALLTLMAVSTATSKTGFKKVEESKLELMQMDILVKPMLFRVEDFGIQAIPIVCISDGAANYISVDDCKRLALRDATKKDEPLPPIVIEKPPFLGIEELMSDKIFHDHVYYMLWNYRFIDDNKKWYTPCVLYYASSWQKNVSNKGRSVSIGVFFGKDISQSKVHIHRRALVAMLNFFGMAGYENTTALAVINSRETRLARTGWPLIVFLLVIPLLPISYLSDPVEDICSRVRGYLLSTGMTHLAYWINTFLMHWVQYAIFYALAIGLLMVTEAYRRAYLILAALLPLFFFGLVSNLLTMYAIAVFIKTHNTLVSTVCVLVGVLLPAAFTLLTYFPAYIFNVLIWTVPPAAPTGLVFHCMLYYFFKAEYYQTVDGSELPGMAESLWKQQEILNCLIAMPVHIIILSGIILFVEKKEVVKEILCHGGSQTMPNKPESDMEEGARKETERVLAAPRNSKNVLEVRKLQKIHANGVHAVRGITFGTMAGEIFGLLGANGAGKSTSMSVIVGEEAATEGVCEVRVHDGAWVSGREGATIGAIGYCPQHNPLFNSITVAEHIRFYAAIRGLDTIEAERQTICLMQSLGLAQHCDKQAGQLSGGNKRRLCLAIAMLGNPALIVIDEASTGVDPENKRFIWGAIRRMVHQQRSVIVTTHSMEEVEALCSRVGIMNKGRMISVGTVQQLQSRHGDAYTLELLLAPDGESAVRQKRLSIKNAVVEKFKGAHTQEDLGLSFVMRFSVPKPAVRSLSPALKWLAANQSRMGVSYWALYQMSLDQVFVNLIKMYDHSARKLAVKSGTST